MLRFGIVTNIDELKACARVQFQDGDGMVSFWLSVLQSKTYRDRAYDSMTFDLLKKMIDEYKNVRSVLEEINIESEFTCKRNWLTYLDAENEVMING